MSQSDRDAQVEFYKGGAMSQLTIRPMTAGEETQQWYQDSGAPGNNYLNVDESNHDDDATRNGAEAGCIDDQWYRDLYAMENCGLPAGTTINSKKTGRV